MYETVSFLHIHNRKEKDLQKEAEKIACAEIDYNESAKKIEEYKELNAE